MQAAWTEPWILALLLKDTKLGSGGNKKIGRNLPAIREFTVLLYFSQVVLSSKKHDRVKRKESTELSWRTLGLTLKDN